MEPNIANESSKLPIICVDQAGIAAFHIFNSNDWERSSRGVVQSCSTELSVLEYGVARISEVCSSGRERCQPHFASLQQQWTTCAWDVTELVYFVQVPELHLLIEGFFSGVKGALDLIVQLLTTEQIVGVSLDGFHRIRDTYGGRVLNALERNARAGKAQTARAVRTLITEHKQLWIDEVIAARDSLVHPARGAHQLMFEIRLEVEQSSLRYREALPPHVGSMRIDRYATRTLEAYRDFARGFLAELRRGGNAD